MKPFGSASGSASASRSSRSRAAGSASGSGSPSGSASGSGSGSALQPSPVREAAPPPAALRTSTMVAQVISTNAYVIVERRHVHHSPESAARGCIRWWSSRLYSETSAWRGPTRKKASPHSTSSTSRMIARTPINQSKGPSHVVSGTRTIWRQQRRQSSTPATSVPLRSDGCSAISIIPTAACDVGEHTNTSSGGTAAAAPGANESAIIAPRQSAKSSTPVASTGPLTRRRCVHAVRPISPSAFSISSGVAPSGRMMSTPVNMFFVLAPEPESRRERPSTELNDARLGREHDDPALTGSLVLTSGDVTTDRPLTSTPLALGPIDGSDFSPSRACPVCN